MHHMDRGPFLLDMRGHDNLFVNELIYLTTREVRDSDFKAGFEIQRHRCRVGIKDLFHQNRLCPCQAELYNPNSG
ncbi:hypothetical protein IGI04_030973 [Brassica rapa subsp. trilocularis]|uniref:Uncharacterized protein n=1 Tax=Brassica rapa subsp. trilocularis TaxID=1813537 RepID=A0ABQ7LS88_BRACM|nr:hypothetical protein IGI04_030973 [Brassica rapa subsp. trilocularis]